MPYRIVSRSAVSYRQDKTPNVSPHALPPHYCRRFKAKPRNKKKHLNRTEPNRTESTQNERNKTKRNEAQQLGPFQTTLPLPSLPVLTPPTPGQAKPSEPNCNKPYEASARFPLSLAVFLSHQDVSIAAVSGSSAFTSLLTIFSVTLLRSEPNQTRPKPNQTQQHQPNSTPTQLNPDPTQPKSNLFSCFPLNFLLFLSSLAAHRNVSVVTVAQRIDELVHDFRRILLAPKLVPSVHVPPCVQVHDHVVVVGRVKHLLHPGENKRNQASKWSIRAGTAAAVRGDKVGVRYHDEPKQ